MGCNSGKPVAAGAHKAQPQITAKMTSSAGCSVTSPTILGHRSAALPSIDVQVVKSPNERKEVFAAEEQLRQPVGHIEQHGESLFVAGDQGMEQQSRPSDNPSLPVEASHERGDLLLPEVDDYCENSPNKCCLRDECESASKAPASKASPTGRPRRSRNTMCDCCDDEDGASVQRKRVRGAEPGEQLENLIEELFLAQDLKDDGLLDEAELVELNEAVADVHDSRGSNSETVQMKYSKFFREKLDPEGKPVPYAAFRRYMLDMLDEIDRNEEAQEMIVEQFLAEARLARTVVTGAPILVDRPRPGAWNNACLRFYPASEAGTEIRP